MDILVFQVFAKIWIFFEGVVSLWVPLTTFSR